MPGDLGEKLGNSFGLDEDHSREPPAGGTRGPDPAPPREPYADSTGLFSIFPLRPPLTRGASAHLTTRTLTQADAAPAVTGHLRNEGTENWPETRGRPHRQRLTRCQRPHGARWAGSRVTAGNEVPHLAAVRPVVHSGAVGVAAVSGMAGHGGWRRT